MQCISSILTFADNIFPINQQMYFHPSIILFMKNLPERTSPEPANLQPPPKKKTKQPKREQTRKKAHISEEFHLSSIFQSLSAGRFHQPSPNPRRASELGVVYQAARLNLPLPPPPAPPTRSCDDVTTGWWRQPSYGVGARVGDVTLAVIDVTVASLWRHQFRRRHGFISRWQGSAFSLSIIVIFIYIIFVTIPIIIIIHITFTLATTIIILTNTMILTLSHQLDYDNKQDERNTKAAWHNDLDDTANDRQIDKIRMAETNGLQPRDKDRFIGDLFCGAALLSRRLTCEIPGVISYLSIYYLIFII